MLQTKRLYKEPCVCSTCMEYVEEYDDGIDDRKPALQGVRIIYSDSNGTDIGGCLISTEGYEEKRASVWSVTVHHDYRRMGHGSRMMVEVMEYMRRMGYERVTLTCTGGIAARKAYERAGFMPDEREKGVNAINNDNGHMTWHNGGAK